ncbi:hypothetical protein [Peribacillus asahii]|uniref:hypothetical protein n=1 Tax=Peribacillus asahii TaxID=228899 RepID=UPI00207977F4|nr:hypothetical protein [Peribacillus asahii]USK59188.1 hypothetical protein LIT37_18715 [Peribacillus asahii]
MNASEIGLLLSYLMALYLFSIAFIEGIKISNQNEKVNGSTLIMSLLFALFFTRMAALFYSY